MDTHSRFNGVAIVTALVLVYLGAVNASSAATPYDWPQFNGDAQHSGNNAHETIINPGTVRTLKQLYQVTLPGVGDSAPAYLSGVDTSAGAKDLLFVTTRDGYVLAIDATSGAEVWQHQNDPGDCHSNNSAKPCVTNSSPAVDPGRQYVYAYGLDGFVRKYHAADGAEVTGGGWPEQTTLKPVDEKGSPALSVAMAKSGASYLYVANGGYLGDHGDYQGHITTINLADGSQHVFNTLCSDQTVHFGETAGQPDCDQVQAAVWARPGVIYNPDTDRIYAATGNGLYDPAHHDWGDSVFALNPDGTGARGDPLDSYTPTDYQQLADTDTDLGSTAPAILPVPQNSKVQHLAVQGGKDGILRLLDLDNLSGQGGPGHTAGEVSTIALPQGGRILTQPAVWVNRGDHVTWVFVANAQGISGLQLVVDASGTPGLKPVWTQNTGGTSPIVAEDVLFYATSGRILGLLPLNGQILWQDTGIGSIHWESPIVANGILYITDESGKLTAYSAGGTAPQG
jgi:outer membrane protein assembly factor BamB